MMASQPRGRRRRGLRRAGRVTWAPPCWLRLDQSSAAARPEQRRTERLIAEAGLGQDAEPARAERATKWSLEWGTWWLSDRVSGVRCHMHSKMPLFLGHAPRPESHSAILISAPIMLQPSLPNLIFSPPPLPPSPGRGPGFQPPLRQLCSLVVKVADFGIRQLWAGIRPQPFTRHVILWTSHPAFLGHGVLIHQRRMAITVSIL